MSTQPTPTSLHQELRRTLIGWTLMTVAAVSALDHAGTFVKARALQDFGAATTATVTDTAKTRSGLTTNYAVTVDVSVPESNRTVRTFSVHKAYFDTVDPGARVPVTYVPDYPETAALQPGRLAVKGAFGFTLALLIGFIGFCQIRPPHPYPQQG